MTRVLAALALCAVMQGVSAYDEVIHELLTVSAVEASVLGAVIPKQRLGLPSSLTSAAGPLYPNSRGDPATIMQLFQDGARFEDDGFRSINHFFDPRSLTPLRMNASDFYSLLDLPQTRDAIDSAVVTSNALAVASPDWALGTGGVAGMPQGYSYKDLKANYFQALTVRVNVVRKQAMGLTFETLGRIVHHIQDMAQPQHVRNDAHLKDGSLEGICFGAVQALLGPLCPAYKNLRRPSTYEEWTTLVRERLPLSGYDSVYGPESDGIATFSDARRFWTHAGKGLADFTNRNFLTVGTMQVAPPFLGLRYTMAASSLCADAAPPCPTFNPDDVVTFFSSSVDDQFRAAAGGPHPYAASDSIFDPDFRRIGVRPNSPTTVNRFTFAYDHAYLLPRAVGYSAGFINYFFRGAMQITPPDEGVYAIVDHGAGGCSDPCGFRKIKLKLRNVTPGGEVMGAGSVWAVVKYHLNNCYKPDLSGEFGAPAFLGEKCRSPDEFISVSGAVGVNQGISATTPQSLVFDFGASPIPINVSDATLQIVFQGKLGSELDAIAVSTENISEPNYYGLTNVSDFVFDTAYQKYYPLGYKNYLYPNTVTNVRFAFGTNSALTPATAVATLDRLGGGEHAQFAVLMPLGQALASAEWEGDYPAPGELNPWDTQQFSMDDDGPNAGQYTRTCPVHPIRGMYRQYGLFFVQQVASHIASSKDRVVLPVATQTTTDSSKPNRANPKAAVSDRCAAWPTTGYYDFSAMPKLTSATAVRWSIRF